MTSPTLATRSLRDRVQARLTHLDLVGYEFDWLDSTDAKEISFQLQWLDDAAAECRVDGYLESAEAYDEVLEIIQIETQKRFS
ncbi:hypothetical protein EDF24_0709 [Curtobacterium sp. PhB130]|uniref:hypothetical protein n=1 Tax=Curtobacterium sp. PhB130 TaxID=2485178 RepID=UPI000F4B2385|nr:hypothetical protein [Curtobacterium sp. PhB130]ROS77940.1 hypothetical protein EDF24_0709 [Curtobacterium sp. PhB130]